MYTRPGNGKIMGAIIVYTFNTMYATVHGRHHEKHSHEKYNTTSSQGIRKEWSKSLLQLYSILNHLHIVIPQYDMDEICGFSAILKFCGLSGTLNNY